jgi:hypothetical protein
MITKKEKKLLLECLEHFMSWEQHMERASVTKMVEHKGLFGIDEKWFETEPTAKYSALIKLKEKLEISI